MADDFGGAGVDIFGSGFEVNVDFGPALAQGRQLDELLAGIPGKVQSAVQESLSSITGMLSQLNTEIGGLGFSGSSVANPRAAAGQSRVDRARDTVLMAPIPRPLAPSRDARTSNVREEWGPINYGGAGLLIGYPRRAGIDYQPPIGMGAMPYDPSPYATRLAGSSRGPIPYPAMQSSVTYRGRPQMLDYDYARWNELNSSARARYAVNPPQQMLPANMSPLNYNPNSRTDPAQFVWPGGYNALSNAEREFWGGGQTSRPVRMLSDERGWVRVSPTNWTTNYSDWTTPANWAPENAFGPRSGFVGMPSNIIGPRDIIGAAGGYVGDAWNATAGATAGMGSRLGSLARGAAYAGAGIWGVQQAGYAVAGLYGRTIGAAATEYSGRRLLAETLTGGTVGLSSIEADLLATQLINARTMGSTGMSATLLGLDRSELADQYRQLAPIIRLGAETEGQFREGLETGALARQLLVARDPVQGTRGAMIALSELYAGGQDRFTSLSRRFELPRSRMLEIEAELDAAGAYYDPSRIVLQVMSEMGLGVDYSRARALETIEGQFARTGAIARNTRLSLFDGSVPIILENIERLNSALELWASSDSFDTLTDRIGGMFDSATEWIARTTANPFIRAAVRADGVFSSGQMSSNLSGLMSASGAADTPFFIGDGAQMGSAWEAFAYNAAEIFSERTLTLLNSGNPGAPNQLLSALGWAGGISAGAGLLNRLTGSVLTGTYSASRAAGMTAGQAAGAAAGRFAMTRVLPIAAVTTVAQGVINARALEQSAESFSALSPDFGREMMASQLYGMSYDELDRRSQSQVDALAGILDRIDQGGLVGALGTIQGVGYNLNAAFFRGVNRLPIIGDEAAARAHTGLNDLVAGVNYSDAIIQGAAGLALTTGPLNIFDANEVSSRVQAVLGDQGTPELIRQTTDYLMAGGGLENMAAIGISHAIESFGSRGQGLDIIGLDGEILRSFTPEEAQALATNRAARQEQADLLGELAGVSTQGDLERLTELNLQGLSILGNVESNTASTSETLSEMARLDRLRLSQLGGAFFGYNPNPDYRNVSPTSSVFGHSLLMAGSSSSGPAVFGGTTMYGEPIGPMPPTVGDSNWADAGIQVNGPYDWMSRMGMNRITMLPGQPYSAETARAAGRPDLEGVQHQGYDLTGSKEIYNPFDSPVIVHSTGNTGEKGRGIWANYLNPETGNIWQASHLAEMPTMGATIDPGGILGLMGNTGSSTGPHLDWRLFGGPDHYNGINWNQEAIDNLMVSEGLFSPDETYAPLGVGSGTGDVQVTINIDASNAGSPEEVGEVVRRELHNFHRDGGFNNVLQDTIHNHYRQGLDAQGANRTDQPSIAE